jgi:hypothetical protein
MAKQTFTTGQVLTAAQMTSLQQTAMGGGSTTAKTTSYTLVAADAGTVVQMNSASATTITVNTGLFAAGDSVQIQNIGAGVCTVTAGTATVNTAGSLALSQWEGGQLYFTATGASIFFDLVQASGTGLVGCALTRTTDLTVANSTITAVGYNTEVWDTDGFHDNSTNNSRITIPAGKAGKYNVSANIIFASNGTGVRYASLYKNGSETFRYYYNAPSGTSANGLVLNTVETYSVGDYLEININQTSGGNLSAFFSGYYNYFSVTYLGA